MSKVRITDLVQKEKDLRGVLDSEKEYDFDLVYSIRKNIYEILLELRNVKESLPEDMDKKNEILNNKKVEIEFYPIKKELFPKTIKPDELPISIINLIE